MIHYRAPGGLDRRANYPTINNYAGAAAMGCGLAGERPGDGEAGWGSGENFSEKLLTFAARPHTLIKLKFGQFWPRQMGGASRRSSKVERLICNQGVAGSSPIAGSREAASINPERYPSGQRGRAVNPLAQPTEVRILPSPPVQGSKFKVQGSRLRVQGSGFRVEIFYWLVLQTTDYGINGGNSSMARASAFQAEGCGFESRFPLHLSPRSSVGRAHPW